MSEVERAIEVLLANWPAGFRNKHLATALRISRARASQILAARVMSGELARTEMRRDRYIRGLDWGSGRGVIARGADKLSFWRDLVRKYPRIAYLGIETLAPNGLRTRQQVRALVRGVDRHHDFVIVDFEGVHFISAAACHELLRATPRYKFMAMEPINACPAVARIIWRALQALA